MDPTNCKQLLVTNNNAVEHVSKVCDAERHNKQGENIRCKRGVISDFFPRKRMNLSEGLSLLNLTSFVGNIKWRNIEALDLNVKYAKIFPKEISNKIFQKLESEIEYFSDEQSKVKVFGKWHKIPRKQVSFGDHGLHYTFSGNCIPALPWDKYNIIKELKEVVESVSQHTFNFVLVNRYKDGLDHIGEHRDDEKDLVSHAPIASLSFGQERDFIFKHKDARGKGATKKIEPVKLQLEHGSLLLMQWPTNHFWYHNLPVRNNAKNVRINLTFRRMVKK